MAYGMDRQNLGRDIDIKRERERERGRDDKK